VKPAPQDLVSRVLGGIFQPVSGREANKEDRSRAEARWESLANWSRRELSSREIVLRSDAKGIGDAIEERKHGGHIHRFRNLLFFPSAITKFLHVFRGRLVSGLRHQLCIFEQQTLGRCQPSFIELAFDDCLYALICGSLNPQEVSMAVQSIRAPVQIGDVTGDHLLVSS
jgi:hypothetical protein